MTGEPILAPSSRHEAVELECRDHYQFVRLNPRSGQWWQMTVPKARLSEHEFDRWKHRHDFEPQIPTAVALGRLSPAERRFITSGSVPDELREKARAT
jgi:hypothetical protein